MTETHKKLVLRLDTMADEATALLQAIAGKVENFGQGHGVSKTHIAQQSECLLKQWQKNDDD